MTLERKIISNFLLLAVFLIAVGVVWEIYYTKINNKQLLESKNASLVVDYTNQMEVGLYQSLLHLNLLNENRSNQQKIEDVRDLPLPSESKKRYERGITTFYSSLKQLEKIISDKPVLLEEVDELKQRILLYENLATDWMEMGSELNTQADILYLTSITPYFLNNVIPKFEKIRTITNVQQEKVIKDLNNQLSIARVINYIATFLILILGVFIAFSLYRSIIQPLQKLTESAKIFGEGKMTERVELKSEDEFSQVAKAFNKMAENLEQQTISVTYLDNVLESIGEGIFVSDENGILKRLNESGAKMLELDKSEVMGKPMDSFFKLVEPENHSKENRAQEYRLVSSKENLIPIIFSAANLYDNNQKKGKVLVVTNISELKSVENELRKSLEEKGVMLAEIHHRVKNNLAVISGLLQLQVMQSNNDEINKALMDSQLRVQSIALIHEKLYGSDSLAYIKYDKYIEDLLDTIKETYSNQVKEIKITTKIDDISLNINQAIPCSLLINEVLINAYKHAFTEQDKGEIFIEISSVKKNVQVSISDNGKGIESNIKKDINESSLGFTLIKTLTAQLDGTSEFKNNELGKGAMFELTFKKEN